MAQKPEIQYVGQFYVHGSEAVAPRQKQKKTPRAQTREKPRKIHRIYVDPVATVGILVAVVMLTVMVIGAIHLETMWEEHHAVNELVSELKRENAALEHNFRLSYDLEEIRKLAETLELVPISEAQVQEVRITPPVPKPERTWWDDVLWFFEGLFA